MTDLAVYEINDYLWNGPTQLKTLIPGDSYPFHPTQQQPEHNEALPERPYIVYTARTIPGYDPYYIMTDQIMYTVWAKDQGTSVPVAREMLRHLRRFDEAASDINAYLQAREGGSNIEFLWIRVNDTTFPNPVDQEGGDYGRFVSVRAAYIDKELC